MSIGEKLQGQDWLNYWNARRHVLLFNRIGRERWIQHYNRKEFIRFIGADNWQRLKLNMKKIMDGEK